jgi:hypothetical protein
VFKATAGPPLLALPEDERWVTMMLKDRYGLDLINNQLGEDRVLKEHA